MDRFPSLPLFSSLPFPSPLLFPPFPFAVCCGVAVVQSAEYRGTVAGLVRYSRARLRSVAARMLSVAHRPVLSVTARPRSVAARLRSMMFSMAPCLRAATRLRSVAARLRSQCEAPYSAPVALQGGALVASRRHR